MSSVFIVEIKHHDQKQCGGESVYLINTYISQIKGSQAGAQIGAVPEIGENMEECCLLSSCLCMYVLCVYVCMYVFETGSCCPTTHYVDWAIFKFIETHPALPFHVLGLKASSSIYVFTNIALLNS